MFTLDHNVWTRNPNSSSEVSKDSDCSLVSNQNIGGVLPSDGLGPGPGELRQGGLKVLHFWRHSQKIRIPNQALFFECRLKDLPSVLSHWTTLYRFQRQINARAKPRAIRFFLSQNPRTLPDAKESRAGHCFDQALQRHNSSANWVKELFKPSMELVSLLVQIEKISFQIWSSLWVMSQWGHLFALLAKYTWFWALTQESSLGSRFFWKLGYNQRI